MVTWQLTIDAHDPGRMVEFWAPALGYEPLPPPEPHATWNAYYLALGVPEDELDPDGDGQDRIWDPTGEGPRIWFQPVPEHKSVKNRLHLDLYPTRRDPSLTPERRRELVDAAVDELVALGATVRSRNTGEDLSVDYYAVGMFDPEGNEFCVS
ncbi:MAG: VOC family protein [Nocardioides sp.]